MPEQSCTREEIEKKIVFGMIEKLTSIIYPQSGLNVTDIYIEGCIGEGKTTLCDNLKKKIQSEGECHFIECHEDVDQFLLKQFYENPKAAEVMLQIAMIVSRIKARLEAFEKVQEFRKTSDKRIYIIHDTGFLTNEAFIVANYSAGHISSETFGILMNTLHSIEKSMVDKLPLPTHVILLKTNVRKCMKNIISRGRQSEKNIPESYIKTLMDAYSDVYRIKAKKYSQVNFSVWGDPEGFTSASEIVCMFGGIK
jgi:deoxyadenosine/deoxycytidine kinase